MDQTANNSTILAAIEDLRKDVKSLDDAVRGTNTTKGMRTEISELQQFRSLVKYLMVSIWTALVGLFTKALGFWGASGGG